MSKERERGGRIKEEEAQRGHNVPMRVTEDRKPENRTGQLHAGCLVTLLHALGVDKGDKG